MRSQASLSLFMFVSLGCVSAAPATGAEGSETHTPTQAAASPMASAPAPAPAPAEAEAEAEGEGEAVGSPSGLTLAVPEAVAGWSSEIIAAAEHHGLDPDLAAVVVWLESNGQPDARSPSGALGLMQMMPATAAAVAERRGEPAPSETELLDPQRNLDLGCAHLAELAAELAPEGLDGGAVHRIAVAYNGGPRVLARWQQGEPLPEETRRYAAAMRERWDARGRTL